MGRRNAAHSAAAAVLLLSTGDADAALSVRLSIVPTTPRVGQSVSVMLRPYFPYLRDDGTCCRLVSADVKGYPFRVEATSPAGRVFRIRVGRTIDRYLWHGAFVFRSTGRWHVRVTNLDSRAGNPTRITVMVRRAASVT
jgi:hypothetical protein